mgnify:CR=1 FL=1
MVNWWIGELEKNSSAVKLSWFDAAEFAWVCLRLLFSWLAGCRAGWLLDGGALSRLAVFGQRPTAGSDAVMRWCTDRTQTRQHNGRPAKTIGRAARPAAGGHSFVAARLSVSSRRCLCRVFCLFRVFGVWVMPEIYFSGGVEPARQLRGALDGALSTLHLGCFPGCSSWLLSPFNLFIATTVAALLK